MYDLIVFDWDGTLMDSKAHIVDSLRHGMAAVGVSSLPDAEQTASVIGLSLREAARELIGEMGQADYEQFAQAYRQHYLAGQAKSRLFEGVQQVVQSLQDAGKWLAIATGKSADGLAQALDYTELGRLFMTTRCADQCFSKPHPDMLDQILGELGVLPERALMVGDSKYDMLMASNARVQALGVACGVHDHDTLKNAGAIDVIADVSCLRDWLNQRGSN